MKASPISDNSHQPTQLHKLAGEARLYPWSRCWLLLALLMPLWTAVACSQDSNSSGNSSSGAGDSARFTAVATTSMAADALRHLLPDSVEVIALMGPGVDPHLYKATSGDLQRILKADLIVYNGLHLEGRMGEALESAARNRPVVAMGELVDATLLMQANENAADPHIWFDVNLWREAVTELADTLGRIFPERADDLRRRADQYADSLGQLDRWVRSETGRIPAAKRILVTAHDAFGYFGRAYAVEVRAVQGISTAAEPGLHDIQALVDYMSSKKVPALFVETSVPKRTVEAVLEGCKKRGHEARLGGELYSDAMGPVGSGADTYTGMIRHNVETYLQAMQ